MNKSRLILILVFVLLFLRPFPASAETLQDELTLGVPVTGSLSGTGDEVTYQVTISAGQHLFVVLDGDDNYDIYDLYIKFGSLPTRAIYDDKGDGLNSDQAVEINDTQAGIYYILVYATSGGASFSIVAHNNSTFPALTIGTPKTGSLQGTYDNKYYQINVTAGHYLLVVLDGDDNYDVTDLYIKFGSLPSTVDYEDMGEGPESDQAVEITNTQAGYYYIMLRSTSGGASFTIVAHNNSTFPTLTIGTPKTGSLQSTYDIKYYQVNVSAGQHLFVVLDGDDNYDVYDLYIKFGSLPSTVDYEDMGDGSESDQAVELPTTQAGYYYVMVRSTSGGANYTITAHTNSTFPTLTIGTPKTGSLQATYDIKYYQVNLTAGQHLSVVLDGDDNFDVYDLYIKFGSLPSTVDYEDMGAGSESDQAVEIPATQSGYYYVMVRSTSGGANYTITAHTTSTFPALTIGTPKTGSLQATFDIKVYQVNVTSGQHLSVVLDGDDNFDVYDLYIKFGSLPSMVDYEDMGDGPESDQAVEIPATQSGYYYVMVRSTSGGANYTITAHTTSTFPALTIGTPKTGSLQATFDIKVYQVNVTSGQHLSVVLDGDDNFDVYDLYIKFGSLPSTVDYDEKGSSPDSDQAVEIPDTLAGSYYVMLRSTSGGARYTLTAHNSTTFPTLILWTPRTGNLQGTYDIKYYQVTVLAGDHLTIVLDGEDNYDVYDLYIRLGSLPTLVDYDAKGNSPYSHQVVQIPITQSGTYYIMLRSTSGGGNYLIWAQNVRSWIFLPHIMR